MQVQPVGYMLTASGFPLVNGYIQRVSKSDRLDVLVVVFLYEIIGVYSKSFQVRPVRSFGGFFLYYIGVYSKSFQVRPVRSFGGIFFFFSL